MHHQGGPLHFDAAASREVGKRYAGEFQKLTAGKQPLARPCPASAHTVLQRWPTGDGSNASSVWNGDVAGNGGFASGGTLATAIGATSTAVQRKNATGVNIGSPGPLFIVSATSNSDAITGIAAGGKALAYNGVSITPANPLSGPDTAKVTEL